MTRLHTHNRRKIQRRRFAARFFRDIQRAWAEHGEAALARAMFTHPLEMLKIVAKLQPNLLIPPETQNGVSDERLAELREWAAKLKKPA